MNTKVNQTDSFLYFMLRRPIYWWTTCSDNSYFSSAAFSGV